MPVKFDFGPIGQEYMTSLVTELGKVGIAAQMPALGVPDQGLVITSQVVRADPGNRFMRYLFTWFAGAAVFEVEGAFGQGTTQVGSFRAKVSKKGGFSAFGGDSRKLLIAGAKQAGKDSAKQIISALAGR